MNSHLNIYKSYSNKNREGYQLEDDLTRSLAIALQENDVFSHQFIKYILNQKEGTYNDLFDDYINKEPIVIDIQKRVEGIQDFDHLFAVRISGDAMGDDFFEQSHDRDYNPITDLYIQIDNVAIIFEVKPNNHNSTAQLYNQALNTIKGIDGFTMEETVTAVDFNWPIIMQLAVRVNNYQEAIGNPSRILGNFISYIKMHNYQWLPQLSLSALSFEGNQNAIMKRLSDAVENSDNQGLNNRLGIKCYFDWSEELLISLNNELQEVRFVVYPGNTKAQGRAIFKEDGEAQFKKEIKINGITRKLHKSYHIKFSGQSYITGIWASENDFRTPLYTRYNYHHHSGRKKRNLHWQGIEDLLDNAFKPEFDWKNKSGWKNKILGSNRTQFDISYGYEISFRIPYSEIQQLDNDKNNLQPLINLIEEAKNEFKGIVLNTVSVEL